MFFHFTKLGKMLKNRFSIVALYIFYLFKEEKEFRQHCDTLHNE